MNGFTYRVLTAAGAVWTLSLPAELPLPRPPEPLSLATPTTILPVTPIATPLAIPVAIPTATFAPILEAPFLCPTEESVQELLAQVDACIAAYPLGSAIPAGAIQTVTDASVDSVCVAAGSAYDIDEEDPLEDIIPEDAWSEAEDARDFCFASIPTDRVQLVNVCPDKCNAYLTGKRTAMRQRIAARAKIIFVPIPRNVVLNPRSRIVRRKAPAMRALTSFSYSITLEKDGEWQWANFTRPNGWSGRSFMGGNKLIVDGMTFTTPRVVKMVYDSKGVLMMEREAYCTPGVKGLIKVNLGHFIDIEFAVKWMGWDFKFHRLDLPKLKTYIH